MCHRRDLELLGPEGHLQIDIFGGYIPHLQHISPIDGNQIGAEGQQEVDILLMATVNVPDVFARPPGEDALVACRIRMQAIGAQGSNLVRMQAADVQQPEVVGGVHLEGSADAGDQQSVPATLNVAGDRRNLVAHVAEGSIPPEDAAALLEHGLPLLRLRLFIRLQVRHCSVLFVPFP